MEEVRKFQHLRMAGCLWWGSVYSLAGEMLEGGKAGGTLVSATDREMVLCECVSSPGRGRLFWVNGEWMKEVKYPFHLDGLATLLKETMCGNKRTVLVGIHTVSNLRTSAAVNKVFHFDQCSLIEPKKAEWNWSCFAYGPFPLSWFQCCFSPRVWFGTIWFSLFFSQLKHQCLDSKKSGVWITKA